MGNRFLRKQLLRQIAKSDPSALADELVNLQEELASLIPDFEMKIDRKLMSFDNRLEDIKRDVPAFLQVFQAIKGEKGERGDSIKGEKGDKGDSVQGPKGDRGEKPKVGIDYPMPKNGRDGRDGKDATASNIDLEPLHNAIAELKTLIGSKATVGDVLSAISDLKDEKRIDWKNIKNTPTIVPSSQGKKKLDMSDMRWHGGGLSASGIYTETPAGLVDGINKTYTVTKTINNILGFAIRGEYIHPADYTFAGGTITFVTALDASLSGSPFSITYV